MYTITDFATHAEGLKTEADEFKTQNSNAYVTLCIKDSLGSDVTVTHLAGDMRMWTSLDWVYPSIA